jgi:hypothetical protein
MVDTFSKVMLDNLNNRGILLPGLSTCKSLQTQKQRQILFNTIKSQLYLLRFTAAGYATVQAWTINEIYSAILPAEEVKRQFFIAKNLTPSLKFQELRN